jgi:rubrerythrin
MDIKKFLSHSAKIETADLDWTEVKRVGLTPDEVFILTYFSDIEGQTILYLRDLLHTDAVSDPDTIAFLSMWNYEEYFHGEALARLLAECGHSLEKDRIAQVRKKAKFREKLEAMGATLLSKVFRRHFPAVFMSWGALNEITTLRGYEQLGAQTQNPVLKTLCERIAKQERRHFAWYFNSARERLQASPAAQRLVRLLLKKFWSPVGAGVKSAEEVARLVQLLFGEVRGKQIAQGIDEILESLPGLQGLSLMSRYMDQAFDTPLFPLTPRFNH